MKIGIYLCGCGAMISDKICFDDVCEAARLFPEEPYVTIVDFICSEEGKAAFVDELKLEKPERVVVAACSPRDHEATFRRCLAEAGLNPYLLQVVNIREQIAWVTQDSPAATEKAISAIRGSVCRVRLQQPLEKIGLEVCPDVTVIGAGPAGIKSALALAEAGRQVVLIERGPAIGGLPVLFEQVFPSLECATCMLEPAMMDILHGEHAERIELLTLAEVAEVNGYYGNFQLKIRQQSRHVSQSSCIGCGKCAAVCPVYRSDGRRAIDFCYDGALPNVPFLDEYACIRFHGEACQACQDACPVGVEVIRLDDSSRMLERQAGAIIVAVGAGLYDAARLDNMGLGRLPEVYDALQFQRILSTNGPTGGSIVTIDGRAPSSIAIIHCAGSLDSEHMPYCSGICCQYAFTFSHQISSRLPDCHITHYHRELVMPGKQGSSLYQKLTAVEQVRFIRYEGIRQLMVTRDVADGWLTVNMDDKAERVDMVILCSAISPEAGSEQLAALLDAPLDEYGFFQELHGRMDACQSSMKGIYPVGACRAPMDIQQSVNEGLSAAGLVLAGLQPGRIIEIEPLHAEVDQSRCSGCRLCISVCPYRAITFDDQQKAAKVMALLCRGCGACVAACSAVAINCHHFSDDQIMAEIKGLLK